MDPETRLLQTSDLTDEFLADLQQHLGPYTVAIARARNNDANTFTALGTGVLVRRGELYGILTAHHCLHEPNPEVELGQPSDDTLLLILRGGGQVVVEPIEALEIALASPGDGDYEEYGPDLTFIQILSADRRGSIAAIGSFWNLIEI